MGTAGQGCTDSSRPVLCWRASVLFLKESRALLWTRSSGTTKIQIYGGLFYGLCCHFWFSLVLMVTRLSILWFSHPCCSNTMPVFSSYTRKPFLFSHHGSVRLLTSIQRWSKQLLREHLLPSHCQSLLIKDWILHTFYGCSQWLLKCHKHDFERLWQTNLIKCNALKTEI